MTDKTIKKAFAFILLLFWGVWFLLVALSNVCDFLMYHELLPPYISFHSGNFSKIQYAIEVHGLGMRSASVLLFVVSLCELLIADCFFISLFQWRVSQTKFKLWVSVAFMASIILMMCFIILSEIFVFYDLNTVFFTMMIALLLSWYWISASLK